MPGHERGAYKVACPLHQVFKLQLALLTELVFHFRGTACVLLRTDSQVFSCKKEGNVSTEWSGLQGVCFSGISLKYWGLCFTSPSVLSMGFYLGRGVSTIPNTPDSSWTRAHGLIVSGLPNKFMCWILTRRVTMLGDGDLGKCLGHEWDWYPHSRPREESPKRLSLPFLPHGNTAKRWGLESGSRPLPGTESTVMWS